MSDFNNNEQMLDMYIFETLQNIEQLENNILETEKSGGYTQEVINEIFRIMHTIKGSSAMMLFNSIANLAHTMEDLFYYIREQKPQNINKEALSDLILEGVDFIKLELEKIKCHNFDEGNCLSLINNLKQLLSDLKESNRNLSPEVTPKYPEKLQYYIVPGEPANKPYRNCYKVKIYFEAGCEMENIRAYSIINNLKQDTDEITYKPNDIIDNENSKKEIIEKGFLITFKSNKSIKELNKFFNEIALIKNYELLQLEEKEYKQSVEGTEYQAEQNVLRTPKIGSSIENEYKEKELHSSASGQNIISVNVAKLDRLMDLVGEMVISEALVTQNPDLEGLELDNFLKAARQHHKIISEVQDLVMSVRMVPLSATFHKMHRIVRDMNKHLNKEAELILIGEETEVDKNIIEHISDPLMHLVRNAIDHGIEDVKERELRGKDKVGKVTIEAKNSGSDVLIQIKDDGKGLNKEKILLKAKEHGLLNRAENEMTEREIYNLTLLPGFSTKEKVSEYSGRGVGMDVVSKNIEAIGGSVMIDSISGEGTHITLKIPLTLAIIDGMNIRVGESRYTIPITTVKESFRPKQSDIITDPDGKEMIMVRGNCYNILRLHQIYEVNTEIKNFADGILIMVEQDERTFCLFADELLGQQQVVVKALPEYIKNIRKVHGISGCTLLGDGSISLILDVAGLVN